MWERRNEVGFGPPCLPLACGPWGLGWAEKPFGRTDTRPSEGERQGRSKWATDTRYNLQQRDAPTLSYSLRIHPCIRSFGYQHEIRFSQKPEVSDIEICRLPKDTRIYPSDPSPWHAAMPSFSCRGSKSPGPPPTPPFLLCDAGDRDRALFIPSLAPAVIS